MTSTPPHRDRVRQVVVALSGAVAALGLAVGVGAFGGTPIAEAGGGALAADATLVAPAGPAFTIWTPIYLGLVLFSLWQLAPARRADPRLRRVSWWVAATMLLNTAWILTVQAGLVALSVVVIAVLLGALVVTYGRLLDSRPGSRVEGLLLDATTGLYLGWVSIATIANAAAALVDGGFTDLGLGAAPWAVLLLVAAAAIGAVVGVLGRGRLAFSAALAWGLAWVAVARGGGTDSAPVVALAAVAAAMVVALTAVVTAVRTRRRA